jgi:hypothetical protein
MTDPMGVSEVARATQLTTKPAHSHPNMWRELTCVALIIMELCWIAPLYYLLARFPTGIDLQRSFIVLGLILLGAYLQARITEYLALNSIIRTAIFAAYLLIGLWVGLRTLAYFKESITFAETVSRFITTLDHIDIWIPKEFGVCLIVLLVGLDGFSVATGLPDPFRVFRRFWVSILMLILFGLMTPDNPDAMPSSLIYLFLITSLVAMSTARLALLGRLRGSQRIPFDLQRALGVGFLGVGLASLSVLVAFLLRSQTIFSLMYSVYLLVVRAAAVIFAIILLPIYLVLYLILPGIKLPASIVGMIQFLVDLFHQIQLFFGRLPLINLSGLFQKLLALKPLVLWILVILGLAGILALVRSWTRTRPAVEGDELQEYSVTGSLIKNVRADLRKRIATMVERLVQRLGLGAGKRGQAAARIRRIYAELINQSARLGSPRPESFTPLEFLPILTQQFPDSAADLDLITQAYIRIRYGELPEFPQQLDEVETAWERVQNVFPEKK